MTVLTLLVLVLQLVVMLRDDGASIGARFGDVTLLEIVDWLATAEQPLAVEPAALISATRAASAEIWRSDCEVIW